MTAIATAVAVGFYSEVTIPNLSLVYVVPVIVAAVAFGLGPSLCSAFLGALSCNFFLTEPRYTLIVDDPANVWAIGLLFVVGCIASAVASTARRRADDAALLKRQAALLQAYGHDLVAADHSRAIISITAGALETLFHVPIVVMLISKTAVESIERRGKIEPLEVETEAAQYSLKAARPVPAGVYPFDISSLRLLACSDGGGTTGRHRAGFRPRRAPI
jgi:K+-sensing histidine kinase KdpD